MSSALETPRGVLFALCGLEVKTATQALKKSKLADTFEAIVWEAFPEYPEVKRNYDELVQKANQNQTDVSKEVANVLEPLKGKLSNSVANLLFEVASTLKDIAERFRPFLVRKMVSGDLVNKEQVMEAVKYLNKLSRTNDAELDEKEFDKQCGVGIQVSNEELAEKIRQIVKENEQELLEQRYLFPYKTLIFHIRDDPRLKWGDKSFAMKELQEQVENLLGPKTEEDEKASKEKKVKPKQKGKGKGKETEKDSESSKQASSSVAGQDELSTDSFVGRDLAAANNSNELRRKHVEITKGVIRTRFPPEPNGFLHIGHAKSMNLNFKGAFKALGLDKPGHTIFRYDDTNPEAETDEYIDSQVSCYSLRRIQHLFWCREENYFARQYENVCMTCLCLDLYRLKSEHYLFFILYTYLDSLHSYYEESYCL